MESKLMFSIIVPVYNTSSYLEKCLNSVLEQTCKDFELIIVNNGSQDDSYIIINKYLHHENIKLINIEVNRGISNARNIALKSAKGRYIIFLDSDDFYINNNFFCEAKALIYKHEYDVILFKSQQYFECNNSYGKTIQNANSNIMNKNKFIDNIEYIVKNNLYDPSSWNKIVKKQVIVDNNLFFIDGIRGEDVEWNYRLMKSIHSIGTLNNIMHAYRIRSTSTSKTGWDERCWNDIYNFLRISYIDIEKSDQKNLMLLDLYSSYYYILLGMASKYENKRLFINKLKKIYKYKDIYFCKKNKHCHLLVTFFGYNISSKLIYKYLMR